MAADWRECRDLKDEMSYKHALLARVAKPNLIGINHTVKSNG
jgi:hypothetical protein